MNFGKLIVFEGIDGSGKTTLIESMRKNFNDEIFFTREPYGTDLKNEIKNIIKKSTAINDHLSTLLAFSLERSYHIKNYILPCLARGLSVISDRFFLSTLAYQGIHISEDLIKKMYCMTNYNIEISCIFFCYIDPLVACQRIRLRNDNNFLDTYYSENLQKVSESYQKVLAHFPQTVYLDMTKPLEINQEICMEKIKSLVSVE